MTEYFNEVEHYRNKNAIDPQTRFWGSAAGQRARLSAIMRLVPMTGQRIVDLGAGTGDLLQLAVERCEVPSEYTGVDIVPEFIEEARLRGLPGNFVAEDVTSGWRPPQADYVVANGLFGHKQPRDGWMPRFRSLTDKMWSWADKGIAFTLISSHSTGSNPEAQYCVPAEMLSEVQSRLSCFAVLDHSYLTNDFTIALFKAPRK